jgi:hypothetical protein
MQEPNGTNKIADWQLRQRQAMPLDLKVELSLRRIRDWCDHWDDMVYVAFSGGLDSTVLLHLARKVLPDCPAVFHDTGLEFPEIRDFVKTIDNVTWTKPRMTFPEVLKKYGYPVVSKRVAQYVGEVQRAKGDTATKKLRTTGIKGNGEYSQLGKVPDKWQYLFDAPFTISENRGGHTERVGLSGAWMQWIRPDGAEVNAVGLLDAHRHQAIHQGKQPAI